MSVLNNNIKKLRKIKGLNQTEFGELFGLSRANIGSYEEGRAQPKMEIITQIAAHFDLDLNDFINKELSVNDLSNFSYSQDNPTDNAKKISNSQLVSVPYVTKSELGKFLSLGRSIESLVLPHNFKADVAFLNEEIHLSGEHGIEIGDVMLLKQSALKEIHHGHLQVIQYNKELLTGICRVEGQQVHMYGLTSSQPIHTISFEDVRKSWTIVGVISKRSANFDAVLLNQQIASLEKRLTEILEGAKNK